jgi:hypothetical protein
VLSEPRRVVLGNDSSNSQEISIVEVVVIVVTVTKVDARVGCASLVDNTTPRGFVRREGSGGRGKPVLERRLEVVCDVGNQSSLSDSITIAGIKVSLAYFMR